MFEAYDLSRRAPRFRVNRLTLCLSAALLSHMSAELALAASPAATLPRLITEHPAAPAKHNPAVPAAPPWTVKNCTDHDPDSLRDIVQNNHAQPGDTVDLSQLPTLCGTTNSTITLTSGEIVLAQDDLTLIGPDSANGTVTVSGGGAYRVFHHKGSGTLSLDSLTVSDGSYHIAGAAYGGCVESDSGNVYLYKTAVTGCTVVSDAGFANGGGVSAYAGNVTLLFSTVSGNQANATTSGGFGGGVYAAGTLTVKYSSISNNAEHDGSGQAGRGGGAFARSATVLAGSTIDDNNATYGSGLDVDVGAGSFQIWNSTISGNTASVNGAIYCFVGTATIVNSTIAFNHQTSSAASAALLFHGSSASSALILQSAIVANNTSGAGNAPADVYIASGHGVLSGSGADNLVIASNIASPPPGVITVTTDPKLGPLQFNGGRTRTHALLPGSPALGVGNNNASLSNDQRGTGYPRTTGPNATVDIGAFQFDSIFAGAFDFQ